MRFKIEENIDLYDEITDIYKNSVIGDLEVAEKKLVEIFKDIVKKEAANFSLITKSAVTDVPYFTIKSRVKEADSFAEKLIRKDIGISLLKELGTTKEDINVGKANLINKLKKLDDIVGLRIVTELREDTLNAYKLIFENIELFESKKVIFFDIKDQPQKMKNGLSIFRIKGEFDGLVCFELQIKSKIDEAWGEMDHTIFYKDHSSSLIKPTVQKTMNNVGFILEKLETLLFDLRHSSQIFDTNSSYIEFENNLYQRYQKPIALIFKQSIPLTEISRLVYFFKDRENLTGDLISEIDFGFSEFDLLEPFWSVITELFHSSHNLIILESLYYCILKTNDERLEITSSNYLELFRKFFNLYIEYLNFEIDKNGEFVSVHFRNLLERNYMFIEKNEVIINQKKIEKYKALNNLIEDTLEGIEIDMDIIKNLYFLAFFSSKYKMYYDEIKGSLEFNIETVIDQIETRSSDYPKNISDLVKNLSQTLKKLFSNINRN